jgi:hypothetical protein
VHVLAILLPLNRITWDACFGPGLACIIQALHENVGNTGHWHSGMESVYSLLAMLIVDHS